MNALRKTVDMLKQKSQATIIVAGTGHQDKAYLVIGVTPDIVAKGIDASRLIVKPAERIGGSGGGRKDFAQAGGNKPENLPAAFEDIEKEIPFLL